LELGLARGRRLLARGAARALGHRRRGGILLYHRVAEPPRDPWSLAVSPAAFERQVAFLAGHCAPLPLAELLERRRRGALPRRAVALTFDDGYADNLHAALPALERHGVPATVYVATGYVGADRPFWWDEAEELLAAAGTVARAGTVQARMRGLDTAGIEATLARLREAAGRAGPSHTDGRPVTAEELNALAASPLVEIGAHSRHHPSLAALDREEIRAEVTGARDDLAELLGRRPASFSYPFADAPPDARAEVAAAGFAHAVGSNHELPVTRLAERWYLPRTTAIQEPDRDFEERMARLLD
jgi:peptidoglycan/xylan/chitin deacetylase (PgdA/CDA1 family)